MPLEEPPEGAVVAVADALEHLARAQASVLEQRLAGFDAQLLETPGTVAGPLLEAARQRSLRLRRLNVVACRDPARIGLMLTPGATPALRIRPQLSRWLKNAESISRAELQQTTQR